MQESAEETAKKKLTSSKSEPARRSARLALKEKVNMADFGDENVDSGDDSFNAASTYTQKEAQYSGSDGESLQLKVIMFELSSDV